MNKGVSIYGGASVHTSYLRDIFGRCAGVMRVRCADADTADTAACAARMPIPSCRRGCLKPPPAASDVILRLSVPQLEVFSALVAEQLIMRAALHYAAAIKDRD